MKVFTLIIAIFAFVATVTALKDAICAMPSEIGDCRALLPRFTYKADTNECVRFSYGGCEGNANNFLTKEECEEKCKE